MCTNTCGINEQGKPAGLVSAKAPSLLLKPDIKAFGEHLYHAFHDQKARICRRITHPSFGSGGTNIPEKGLEAYLQAIRDYRPHLLGGLPLYLYALAKHLIRTRLAPPDVGLIKPFGGSSTPGLKDCIRKAFPFLKRRIQDKPIIYLDHATTTQKPKIGIDTLTRYYETSCSNIHRGIHTLSQESSELYEKARAKVARFINANEREIIFVRNTTEASTCSALVSGVGERWNRPPHCWSGLTYLSAGSLLNLESGSFFC